MRQVQSAAFASAAGLTGLRGAVLTAGAAFLGATVAFQAFGRAVQSAAQLESDLNVFAVTAGATADQMVRVREEARALGRDLALPGVAATDAAETFLTLSRAGLSVEDSLAGARGTLQLATAAQIEFTDAAQLTASALNAFQIGGENAIAVADTLTNAANASQASIAQMGIALQQSSAIASQAGFSFGETATFLTQLARAGLVGSDAGTSFRVAIQRLIAPTETARKEIERLNLNLRDAQGNLRPEVFFELGEALNRMGRAQADATRQVIFGNDASRAAAFFARINADAFREQERELSRAGAAAEVAGARNEGFAGSVENVKNQITALGIELGELALPALEGGLDATALLFGALANQIADTREVFGGFAEDAEKIRVLLDDIGVTDFAGDVVQDAEDFADAFGRASEATDEFFADLLGIRSAAEPPIRAVRELTEEERAFAEAITDVHDRADVQVKDLGDIATAAQRAAGAIKSLTGQLAGIQEQVTRARIAGDEGAELDLLQQERDRLQRLLVIEEGIVREGGAGAATARQRIRQEILPQLEGVNAEIRRIIEGQAAEARNIADDAARLSQERDRAFLEALASTRADFEFRIDVAGDTAGLQDDIRRQENLQALIRIQIGKIRLLVKDIQLRNQAIQDLQNALREAEQEEKRLRAQQKQQAQEAAQELLDIQIQIAQEKGLEALEERLIRQKIARLRKRIKAAKGDRLLVAQLQLELAQTQNALKELNEQEEETGEDARKRAAQFFFEQLQAQQGFAANLLGNLIPRDQTAGLVGVPSVGPGRQIQAEAQVAAGRAQTGPTSGQVSTTNDILLRILQQLKSLNNAAGAPEAVYQKKMGAAAMSGGGGNVEVM
jgi:TP901 family phage tail tape measure protein